MHKFPKFIGHRGASGFAPENTCVSMRIAKECGAQVVEFDVKKTKDSELIIMHDSSVDRTTNGHGRVIDMTLAEIKKLDAGCWFDPSFSGETIPTLKEMFSTLRHHSLGANIEIKPCPGTDIELSAQVIEFIENYWPNTLNPPLVSSFSVQALKTVREKSAQIPIGLIFDNPIPNDWKARAFDLKATAISVHHKSIENIEMIKEMHKEGYSVLAYTVNDHNLAKSLYDLEVDSIFTNYPGGFKLK